MDNYTLQQNAFFLSKAREMLNGFISNLNTYTRLYSSHHESGVTLWHHILGDTGERLTKTVPSSPLDKDLSSTFS